MSLRLNAKGRDAQHILSELEKLDRSRVHYADFSFSSHTTENILKITKMLPNCRLVNLTGLSLDTSALTVIRELVRMRNMDFVIVCLTALASSFCWRAYDLLTKYELQKIVFVPTRAKLEKGDWRSMVHNKDKHSVVKKAHTYFFDNYLQMAKRVEETVAEAMGMSAPTP